MIKWILNLLMFWDDRKVVQEMIHKLVYSTWMTLQTYPSVRASCMYTLTVEVFLWILKTTVIPHNFGSATRYMRFKNLYVQKFYNIALEQTPNPVQQPVYVSDFYFYLGVLFWGGLGLKISESLIIWKNGGMINWAVWAAANLDGRASTDGSKEYPQVRHRIAFLQVLRGSDVPANTREKINGWEHK